jgi:predicted TIM-barrel fold metal-dependent hydrolase
MVASLLYRPTHPMKLSPTQSILQPHIRTIDVHHHFFPVDLNKEKSNIYVGWKTPPENLPWTPEKSLQAMDAMKIDFAILSLPPISSGSINEENRLMARRRNEFAAEICSTYPNRFGFFATPPFLDDVEGE